MTTTDQLTFQKTLADGVTVHIRNIPGRIKAGGEHDYHKQFIKRQTARRLEHLLKVARIRMAGGETDIRLDYADGDV